MIDGIRATNAAHSPIELEYRQDPMWADGPTYNWRINWRIAPPTARKTSNHAPLDADKQHHGSVPPRS